MLCWAVHGRAWPCNASQVHTGAVPVTYPHNISCIHIHCHEIICLHLPSTTFKPLISKRVIYHVRMSQQSLAHHSSPYINTSPSTIIHWHQLSSHVLAGRPPIATPASSSAPCGLLAPGRPGQNRSEWDCHGLPSRSFPPPLPSFAPALPPPSAFTPANPCHALQRVGMCMHAYACVGALECTGMACVYRRESGLLTLGRGMDLLGQASRSSQELEMLGEMGPRGFGDVLMHPYAYCAHCCHRPG